MTKTLSRPTASPGSRNADWLGMNWIRQEKRLAIYLRDGCACAYCGAAVETGAQLTLDHLRPVSKGGSNEAQNLVTACVSCNSARGRRSVVTFAEAVATYQNRDVTLICAFITKTRRRTLPLQEAKALIALRGSTARALAARSH